MGKTVIKLAVVIMIGGAVTWVSIGRIRALPTPRQNPTVETTLPVRTIVPGQKLPGHAGVKGATYLWFDQQAVKVTTRFRDAIATTERGAGGDVVTRLTDNSGNELARLRRHSIDSASTLLQYIPATGDPLQAYADPGVHPTLDWLNKQAYSLAKDDVDGNAAGSLEWKGGLMRPRGAAARDIDGAIFELDTEWIEGLRVKASRRKVSRHEAVHGRFVTGDAVVAHVFKDGADAGVVNWFPREQLLTWKLPGLTTGSIASEQLVETGGWPFVPDIAWVNVQSLAFHYYKTLIRTERFVAERRPPSGPFDRIASFFTPTLSADEPGCDELHWLDGTVFRFCCDVHDYCYAKNGCNAKSWWEVWSSWKCDMCNAWVVDCFVHGGDPALMIM